MKNKFFLRIMSMLMLVLLLAGSVACGNPGISDGTTTAAEAESTAASTITGDDSGDDTVPQFREANYKDEDFTLFAKSTSASSYNTVYMMSDGYDGDLMNDAVYRRNVAVEDKYHIKLKMFESNNPAKDLPGIIKSGDKIYDLMFEQRRNLGSLITAGHLLNMLEKDDIMNFESSYWDANAYKEYQVANKLFMMPNDVSTQNLAGVRFLYFNKNLIKQFGLTSPYTYVDDKDWTLEHFVELCSSCVDNVNGDDKYDINDIIGIVYDTTLIKNLISGCGVKFTETNKDGTIKASFNNERTESVISTLRDGLMDKNYASTYDSYTKGADTSGFSTKYTYSASFFASDKFLFLYWGLNATELLSGMVNEGYGVAPNPKYNKDQDRYYHRADGYVSIFSIPACTPDFERTATVLEYWAYISSQTVMPSYYDVTIKSRRVGATQDAAILDIVKSSIRYEISAECQSFGIDDILNEAYTDGNFSSKVKSAEKSVNLKIQKFYDDVAALK